MNNENECLTYQEEIALIDSNYNELRKNIIINSNNIQILKDKLLIRDIIFLAILILIIIMEII